MVENPVPGRISNSTGRKSNRGDLGIAQGWYSLTWISKDQIKFEQKLSLFDQIFGSAQIGIHETFDLIF